MIQTVSIKGYRFYKINGEYFPSVTSILSQKYNPALEKWREGLTPVQVQAILHYTSLRGEIIHYLALKHYETETLKQQQVPVEAILACSQNAQMRKEVKIALKLFAEFRQQHQLEAVRLERCVWNDEYQYAGRVDLGGYLIDEENDLKTPILMDIKTSKEVWVDSASLQLSAYNYCIKNRAKRLFVLLLHPGETTINSVTIGANKPYWKFQEVPQNFEGFKGFLEAFEVLKPLILNGEKIKT